MGFSLINHPFLGTAMAMEPPIEFGVFQLLCLMEAKNPNKNPSFSGLRWNSFEHHLISLTRLFAVPIVKLEDVWLERIGVSKQLH